VIEDIRFLKSAEKEDWGIEKSGTIHILVSEKSNSNTGKQTEERKDKG